MSVTEQLEPAVDAVFPPNAYGPSALRMPPNDGVDHVASLSDEEFAVIFAAEIAGDWDVVEAADPSPRGPLRIVETLRDQLWHPELRQSLAGMDPARLIELIGGIERAQSTLGALQAEAEVAFREQQLEQQRSEGVPYRHRGRGIADQIALARRISPKVASDQLALHRVLVDSLPCTMRSLCDGEISELASERVAQAVLVLDEEDRAAVDQEIAADLPTMTAQRAGRLARARADAKDPRAAVTRHARAVGDRCVSIRPAPDTMVYLSALLPVHQGVAALAALDKAASAQRSAPGGDPRSRGQIMADIFVERLTGQSTADDVPVEIELVMTDTTLLGGADDTARIGGQLIPGAVARHLALRTGSSSGSARDDRAPAELGRWVRRLYADEPSGTLTRADARRRLFSGEKRRLIRLRDPDCRTPWCDAPTRDIDHATPYAEGGLTSVDNGVGHCTRFNLAKELPGWTSQSTPEGDLTITTPTGHHYASSPPRLRDPSSSPPATGTARPANMPSSTGTSPPANTPSETGTSPPSAAE